MTTQIQAQLDYFLRNVRQEKQIERMAIEYHLKVFKSMIPVLQKWGYKVVNKRLTDALMEAAEAHVSMRKESYGTYLESYYSNSIKTDKAWKYASRYRECSFKIHYSKMDDKRLDAPATLESLNDLIEGLERTLVTYDFDEAVATEKFYELKRIEEQLEKLMDGTDSITKAHLKTICYNIR